MINNRCNFLVPVSFYNIHSPSTLPTYSLSVRFYFTNIGNITPSALSSHLACLVTNKLHVQTSSAGVCFP